MAGFEVLQTENMAEFGDPETPWYLPLKGEPFSLTALRRSSTGRYFSNRGLAALEAARIAPRGSTEVSDMLNRAADALVAVGERASSPRICSSGYDDRPDRGAVGESLTA